jgi:hypothetical protein
VYGASQLLFTVDADLDHQKAYIMVFWNPKLQLGCQTTVFSAGLSGLKKSNSTFLDPKNQI